MKKVILSLLVVLTAVGLATSAGNITIKGSDTLVRLGQRWAERVENNPEVVIQVSRRRAPVSRRFSTGRPISAKPRAT